MLHSISWQQFFTGIAIAVAIYYAAVILLFFRKEVSGILRGRLHENKSAGIEEAGSHFALVHDLQEELKDWFHTAAKNKVPKEEVITALQGKLRQYRALKGTPLQESLARHMAEECKKIGVELTESDQQQLW